MSLLRLPGPSLNRRANGHHLIGVDALNGSFPEFLHQFLHGRNPGGTANQNNLVNFARLETGVGEARFVGPAVASTKSAVNSSNLAG